LYVNNPNQRRNNVRRNNNSTKQPKPFNYKAVSAVVPFRIKANRVMTSTPVVSNSIVMRRWFRISDGEGPAQVTINTIRALSLASIGISPVTGASTTFAVHGGRVFTTENQDTVQNIMDVRIHDTEETGSPVVSQFTAASSNAGIAHVEWVHPINNRPTFSVSTVGTPEFINVSRVGTSARVVIDVEMTICITKPA
jgi:hypothetical protein